MAYGNSTTVQELVWGAAKSSVPASVTAALAAVTTFIDSVLNNRSELTGSDKPAKLDTIANFLAAGIIQEQRQPDRESQNTKRGNELLNEFKDETSGVTRGEPYHVGYVEP